MQPNSMSAVRRKLTRPCRPDTAGVPARHTSQTSGAASTGVLTCATGMSAAPLSVREPLKVATPSTSPQRAGPAAGDTYSRCRPAGTRIEAVAVALLIRGRRRLVGEGLFDLARALLDVLADVAGGAGYRVAS